MKSAQNILQWLGFGVLPAESLTIFDFIPWEKGGIVAVLLGGYYLVWQTARKERVATKDATDAHFDDLKVGHEKDLAARDKEIAARDKVIAEMQRALDKLRGE